LDGFALPVKKLKGTNPIETLDLSGKNLGVASAVVIASLISVNGGLNKMSLAENKLGEEGTRAICEALEQNKTLKQLEISGGYQSGSNIGGSAGAKHVAKMLGVNGGLMALDLSNNGLEDEGVSAVCEAIQSNKETKLASLNFMHNGIGPVGSKSVAAMVAVTGALTKLSLAQNKLEEAGTKAICEALEQNTTLKELDINGDWQCSNTGGSAGAKHVAKMVRVNGALTSVKLGGNKLGDEGWGAIFAAVCGNKDSKIMSLDASSWNIGPAGVKLIAEALGKSITGALTSVNLRGGKLGDKGWGAIFAAVCGNKDSKIMSLDASCENIGPAGVKLIAKALRTSVKGALTVTNLLGNTLDAESAKLLAEVAKQKAVSLCGIQHDQTTADFSFKGLKPPDAILLASDLSQAVVTGALTEIK
jgi:hypothetical protein